VVQSIIGKLAIASAPQEWHSYISVVGRSMFIIIVDGFVSFFVGVTNEVTIKFVIVFFAIKLNKICIALSFAISKVIRSHGYLQKR
jgi:hypothetical protein